MAIKSQSTESIPNTDIVYPWAGKHIDKNGPIVFFHAEFKGIVVDGGETNAGASFPIGTYHEGWSMKQFKEYKGRVTLSFE
jgi:hypothetical protein